MASRDPAVVRAPHPAEKFYGMARPSVRRCRFAGGSTGGTNHEGFRARHRSRQECLQYRRSRRIWRGGFAPASEERDADRFGCQAPALQLAVARIISAICSHAKDMTSGSCRRNMCGPTSRRRRTMIVTLRGSPPDHAFCRVEEPGTTRHANPSQIEGPFGRGTDSPDQPVARDPIGAMGRSVESVETAVAKTLDTITAQECANYLANAGYRSS